MHLHQKQGHQAYLGLGGNIGDVMKNMQSALEVLAGNQEVELMSVSSVYETPPWGNENQNWFLNACVKLETTLTAHELLKSCLDTEISLKRIRKERWGPRTIDMDVLIFGDQVIKDETLYVPHPRMHERAFVLVPLSDIAPNLLLKDKAIKTWVNEVDTSEIKLNDGKLSLPNL